MNGTKSKLRHVAAMFTKRPCLFVSCLLCVFLVVCSWYCSGENISLFPIQRPLFPHNGKVHEIIDGSLDTLSGFIDHGSLKFVMYYAPWCGQSRRAVPEFIQAANRLQGEVTFIAINCWSGPCQKEYQLEYFPQIVAYHTIFPGIQYPDSNDIQSLYMVKFLKNVLRPFSYLGREHEIRDAQATHQEIVLSYIKTIESREYKRFFGAALEYVGKVSKPFFGMVLNTNIANKVGLQSNGQLSYFRALDRTLTHSPKSNSSIKNITSWISKHRKQIISELIPQPSQKQALKSKLNEKPAVILFLPLRQGKTSGSLLSMYTRIATEYNNCTCMNKTRLNKEPLQQASSGLDTMVNPQDIQPSRTLNNKYFTQMIQGTIACKSFLVQNKLQTRGSCDMCCLTSYNCDFIDVRKLNPSVSQPPICWSISKLVARANLCCYGDMLINEDKDRSKYKIQFTSDQVIVQKWDSFLDGFYEQILKVLKPLQDEVSEKEKPLEKTKSFVKKTVEPDVKNVSGNHGNILSTSALNDNTVGCNRTGHVMKFHGASCYSNRSVNFFYMDVERFWGIAKRLGINQTAQNKVSLVIVDAKDEAYHVMDDNIPVTNQSIVQFVMEFMNSRLERTFHSAATSSQACPKSTACVIDVTLATLNNIVMDTDKDVLLVYYAPWCGFCINLAPVLLTVARFFKDFKNVVIARIDADKNDLPWQHTVTSYPTIILYPAKRKDFSVRFPDSAKRTAEALIQFVLHHGTVAAHHAFYGKPEQCSHCDSFRERVRQLESSLHRVEEEKKFLETRLESILLDNSLLKTKQLKHMKTLHEARKTANEERDLRIDIENKVLEVEDSQREAKEMNLLLVLRNTQLEKELSQLKEELLESKKKSSKTNREFQQVIDFRDKIQETNELLVKKLHLAVIRISELQKINKVLVSKLRLIRTSQNTLQNRLTKTSLTNYNYKKMVDDLTEEKKTLTSLLKDSATTIKTLKASLASFEKRLGMEEEKHNTAVKRHQEASDKLKEMENNYEKLTVILRQINIPKKQQLR